MLLDNKKISPSLANSLKDGPDYILNGFLKEVRGAYWQWNLRDKTISWSPQAAALLGMSSQADNQPQSEFLSIVYFKTLTRLMEAVDYAPMARETQKVEICIQNSTGNNRWLLMIIFPGYTPNFSDQTVCGVMLDITVSKKLEYDLNAKESLLADAGRIAKLGAWEVNLNTQDVYWTEEVYNIHEVPDGFVPTLDNTFDFYVEESRDILKKSFQELMNHGIPYKHELQLRTFRGNIIWVRVQSSPIFFKNELAKVRGFIQDITSEKEYEEQLQAQKRLFHSTFQNAPTGKALITRDEVTINETLRHLLGYDPVFYQQLDWDKITVVEDQKREEKLRKNYAAGKTDYYSMEKRFIRKDGQVVWTYFQRTMFRDKAGNTLFEMFQIEDIHQQKTQELAKNLEINNLSTQNEQLNNFAHIVSHNLRSHSGNLEMLCYLYEVEENPQEREQLFDNIKRISEGLGTTIGHLSDMVKTMQDSNRKTQLIPFQEVLESTLQALYGQIEESGVEIESDFTACPEIDYAPVYLDSIFLNLISNGIKYRAPGRKPFVRIRSYRQSGRIYLSFSDNGLGIDLEQHGKKLFGLYKTFHGNSNSHGVGLFLTRNQVESMGGKITVESQPDEGTTFTIMF